MNLVISRCSRFSPYLSINQAVKYLPLNHSRIWQLKYPHGHQLGRQVVGYYHWKQWNNIWLPNHLHYHFSFTFSSTLLEISNILKELYTNYQNSYFLFMPFFMSCSKCTIAEDNLSKLVISPNNRQNISHTFRKLLFTFKLQCQWQCLRCVIYFANWSPYLPAPVSSVSKWLT